MTSYRTRILKTNRKITYTNNQSIMYKNETSTLLPFLLFQLFVIISTAYKYKRTTYQWKANLHRSTGVATSFEQSIFKSSTSTSTLSASKDSQNIIIILQEIFSRYPKYLSRPSLTFGLCKTSSSSSLLPSSSSITNNLQSSILHLNLLSFGTPRLIQSSSSSSKKKLLKDTKYCRQSINSMNDDNVDIICCVEIPIVGGLLANINIDCKEEVEDNGCLRFTFLQQQQQSTTTPQSTNNNNNHDNQITTRIVLTTQIAGNYRPTIACGTSSSSSSRLLLPISKFRKLVYCSTQRMVHTYVMWRYHDHVVNEYMKKIILMKKT